MGELKFEADYPFFVDVKPPPTWSKENLSVTRKITADATTTSRNLIVAFLLKKHRTGWV